MDPQELLQRLCRRHGVSPDRGERLLPLVRWALESPLEIRRRILGIVEETLAWHGREAGLEVAGAGLGGEGGEQGAAGKSDPGRAAHPSVLVAVARVLHGWSPSDRILGPGPEAGEAD